MNVKKLKRILMKTLLPHLSIVLSGMLIVLLAIDRVNSAMIFIDNDLTKGIMWILCAASIVNGAQLLTRPRKSSKSSGAAPASKPASRRQ